MRIVVDYQGFPGNQYTYQIRVKDVTNPEVRSQSESGVDGTLSLIHSCPDPTTVQIELMRHTFGAVPGVAGMQLLHTDVVYEDEITL